MHFQFLRQLAIVAFIAEAVASKKTNIPQTLDLIYPKDVISHAGL